ncbi:MAG TPA: ATP-binding cassette domain-containing protein [Polyangiaceae bacterium]|nr:ATP-binding cassette domain-containing protein [Polyangiaceae bacterium]
MARIALEDLSFGFDVPLFESLSIGFEPGWTGLVGANGSGKTTLLRLIAGELEPSSGRVRIAPDATLAWCRQRSQDQYAELVEFVADCSKAAGRWRGLLGVEAAQLDRFEQLSAGERKRWQLALALSREPDVLLLDEPTNHLDVEARSLIVDALRRFEGVGIVVSHDRELLERVTVRTARITRTTLELSPGAYTAAQAEWQAQRRASSDLKAELRQSAERLARRADDRRRRAASAERDRSPARRMKNPHDNDARSMLAKNRAETAGRRLARDASALDSRVARVREQLSAIHIEKELGGELFADYVPWSKPLVLRVAFDALEVPGKRLLGPTVLDIARGDKLALGAPNGSGKTSLIGELWRQNPGVFERSVVLPQSIDAAARRQLTERLGGLDRAERGRVLSFVAALGSDPDAVLRSPAWSPGQTRKVALALGLAAHAPALILDEPTNHFDLPSIERLERLLVAFPGCVVLVTHDSALAARVATRSFSIEAGVLIERPLPPRAPSAGARALG